MFSRQTWTLTKKNLLVVLWRHLASTTFRAFLLPVVFMFFISYAKNFFVPPSEFGIGQPRPVRSLEDAMRSAGGGHDTVAFVNNGFTDGTIGNIINELSATVRNAGLNPVVVENETDLLSVCKSSLRGATRCYAAANFHSSPTQGDGRLFNYTIHADGSLGDKIFVNSGNNDQQIYILPFQHAIDTLIANASGKSLPQSVEEYPYTYETNAQRAAKIVRLYQGTLQSILSVAFFLGMVGVTYQLTGLVAMEREIGMSALIEAMMPNKRRWLPQAARLLSYHLAFDIMYLPGWIVSGALVCGLVFPDSNYGLLIVFHILAGLSLTSYSIFFATFFRKAQLSGITCTVVSIVLAIIAQVAVGAKGSAGAVALLSLLFPSMNYTFFLIYCSYFQQISKPTNLTGKPPKGWQLSGIVLWVFLIIQIIVFPILAALVERLMYETGNTDRTLHDDQTSSGAQVAVKIRNFNKIYGPSRMKRFFLSCFRRKIAEVHAVKDLDMDVVQGQIAILVGSNGSGKSTLISAITGLHSGTSGTIELDGRGGIGLCPQGNVLWDDVTVNEHCEIFNSLKATTIATKAETEELVTACDLAHKQEARSKTLSGGQKRKLQLAMMLTGGSAICVCDEVSSGVDPLARRKIWDILLAERGRRTILLTSHFLDEADVLSDHLYFLSMGVLKAEGSAVEVKHRLGGGFRVIVDRTDYNDQFPEMQHYFDYNKTVFQLNDSSEVSQLIAKLDTIGIKYEVVGPTVENVFLRLADEMQDEFGGEVFGKSQQHSLSLSKIKSESSQIKAGDSALDLRPGRGTTWLQQVLILFRKRFIVLGSNYMPYIFAVVIPVIAGGLVTMFLDNFDGISCSPDAGIQVQTVYDLSTQNNIDIVYGPPALVSPNTFAAIFPNVNSSSLHPVNTLDEFNAYIDLKYANVTPGGFFLSDGGAKPTFAYIGNYYIQLSTFTQNLVDIVTSGVPITTQYSSFSIPWAPKAGSTLQLILYFGLAMCAYPALFALYPTAERTRRVRALHYSNGVRASGLWSSYIVFDFLFVLLVSVVVIALWVGLWGHWYHPGYLFLIFMLYGLTALAFSYLVSLFATSQLAAFAFAAGTQAVFFLIYLIAYLSIITYAPADAIDHDLIIAHFTISLISPAPNLLRALLLTLNEFSVTCKGFELNPYPGAIVVYGGPILYLIIQFVLLIAFVMWWDSGGRPTFFWSKSSQAKDIEQTARDQDAAVVAEAKRIEAEPNSALRVSHLTKDFGKLRAVDDVSFGIEKGECFALLGPNGAGKTTCISLIRGDVRPSTKNDPVYLDGVSLTHHRDQAKGFLGVCPQFDAMDTMSVVEHLRFYARIRGVQDVEHNVTSVMAAVGITRYADRLALTLSGGNKRKLSLAIALMGNPTVVVLDEPSSGMDAAAKRVMWRVLGSISAGRALLISTHSLEEADALANRAGILASRMLAIGSIEELRRQHGDAHHVHLIHKDAPHTTAEDMEKIKQWVRRNVAGATVEDRTYHGQLRFSVPNDHSASSATGSKVPVATAGSSSTPSSASSTFHDQDDMVEPVKTSSSYHPPQRGHSIRALFDLLESHKEMLGIAYYSVSPTTLDQIFLNVVRKHNVEEENSHAHDVGKRPWWKFWDRSEKRRSAAAAPKSETDRDEDEAELVEEHVQEVGKGGGKI